MTETLNGRQVLALLAQDEVPEIEQQVGDRWARLIDIAWHPFDLRNTSTVFRIKPTPQRRLSVTLASGEVVSWPEPVREALKPQQEFWLVDSNGKTVKRHWDEYIDHEYLAFGNVHLTREAAQEHADALCKINTQGVTC